MNKYIILILIFCFISCNISKQEEKKELFLLGLDGFNWHVAYPLIKQGLLPNVEKLMEKGIASPFKSFIPTVSPILWTSLATGKTPQKHRIFWRVVSKNKEDPDVKFSMSSQERECKAFWNILSDARLSVDLINWWCSWPAEEINGYNVTFSYMQYDETESSIHPPEFSKELDEQSFDIGIPDEMSDWLKNAREKLPEVDSRKKSQKWGQKGSNVEAPTEEEISQLINERFNVVKAVAVQDNKVRTISEYILDHKRSANLFASYFWYVDLIQHHYWKYMEPQFFNVNDREMEVLNGVIPAYFRYMDNLVGRMIRRMNPGSHIIICSDHGMHPGQREKQISEHINVEALLKMMDIVKKYPDVKINIHDSIRTVRTFRIEFPVSYNKEDKNEFIKNFEQELKSIKGVKNGVSLFDQVIRLGEEDTQITYEDRMIFLVDPSDIALTINIYMEIDEIISLGGAEVPVKKFVPYTPQPSGNHPDAPDGFFLAYGPNFESGVPPTKPTILDITPTILYFFGLPVAEDMDGIPFLHLFKDEYKNSNPVKTIKTYEQDVKKKVEKPKTREHKNEMIEQLKSLGYIQ